MNCVISLILHMSSMFLYLHLELALHDIKVNGKIHFILAIGLRITLNSEKHCVKLRDHGRKKNFKF